MKTAPIQNKLYSGLTPVEEEIIKILREISWGELTVKIQAGKPVMLETKRTTKLV